MSKTYTKMYLGIIQGTTDKIATTPLKNKLIPQSKTF